METEKANKHHSIIVVCSRPSIFSREKRSDVVALTDYEGNSLFKGKDEDRERYLASPYLIQRLGS